MFTLSHVSIRDIGDRNWQPHNGRGYSDNIEAGNNNPRLEDSKYIPLAIFDTKHLDFVQVIISLEINV